MGPFINDHGDCQIRIEFEASQMLQTDSEVLLTDSNLTWNSTDSLTLNSRTKDGVAQCYLHFIGWNYWIIKFLLSYLPNS